VTDEDWYRRHLYARPDEVNFWQPSGHQQFRALQSGEPFLFKLHSPKNFIVGGGFFVRYSPLPVSVAWEAFGLKNGVSSQRELMDRVRRYRSGDVGLDPVIGCNVLTSPFLFQEKDWIPVPPSWAPNIVRGKTYDTESAEGQALWESVKRALGKADQVSDPAKSTAHEGPRFGAEFLTRSRLGQGTFRVLVIEAYQRRCAVTGEKTLPVLQAAHIKPYADGGEHRVSNGLLLRSDLHKLFDTGYITVTPEMRVEVSARLRAAWHNGREYYAFHGKELSVVPAERSCLPDRTLPDWHNSQLFKS
jgi:putative restriction endonuclease